MYNDHPANEGHILKIIAFINHQIPSFMHQADIEVLNARQQSLLKNFQNPIPVVFTWMWKAVAFVIGEHSIWGNTPETLPLQRNNNNIS